MKREYFFVDDREGNAVAGAEVYVKDGGGSVVTIYSDNGVTPQTNPMATNNDGECNCFVADGTYTIEVWVSGVLQQTILAYQIYDESGFGSGSGDMLSTNNLSDVTNVTTARTNLGVYSTTQVDSAIAAAAYTDEQAQDAVAAAIAAGTHSNVTITYNDAGNSLSFAAAAPASVQYDPIRGYQTAAIIPMVGSNTMSGNVPGFSAQTSSITGRNPASTNLLASLKRWGVETSSAANSQAYIYSSGGLVWRGNAAGRGGFVIEYVFGIETQATNGRGWFGLNPATAWTATDSASSKTDIIGVGWDTGDTQLQLMTNDAAGTATKTALGASFPITANAVYRVRLTAAANASSISYTVTRLDSAATASGSVSSDLPTNTQFLTFQAWASNGGTAAQQILAIAGMQCYDLMGQAA